MNAKERVLTAINHEKPDKVPTYEGTIDNLDICQYYGTKYWLKGASARLKRGYYYCLSNKKYLTWWINNLAKRKSLVRVVLNRIFKLYSRIGIDLFCSPLGLIPIKWSKNGFIDEFGRVFKFYKDDTYKIDMVYYTGGVFETMNDFCNFPEPDISNPIKKNMFKASKLLEKRYDVCAGYLILGVFESVWQSFGLQNFSRLRIKEKRKLFNAREKYAKSLLNEIAIWNEFKEGVVFLSDDYGYKNGLFMHPSVYRNYIIPAIKRIVQRAHNVNLKVIMHSCGDILEIFDDLVKTGIDAIHPIEPTTANPDYNIFKLHEKYGDKLCFIGNVSPQHLALNSCGRSNELNIYFETRELLERLAPNGGFILSSGHSINPAVKLKNLLAMREALDDYNKNET